MEMARAPVYLTLLSTILGPDFPTALERQRAVGIRFLDLKDGLWGKTIEQLDEDETERAASLITVAELQVHCFSTSVGLSTLEPNTDEATFRARHEQLLRNALRVAHTLRPQMIRLLPPHLSPMPGELAIERLFREFPWAIGVYQEWIDTIIRAGFGVLIENEARGCLLGSVADILQFFAALNRPDVRYTWDVQNLWQSGTFPSREVYQQLRPLMGALHLKGGRAGEDGFTLAWASSLEDASWPVLEIVRAVVADGTTPYICLNPSHGQRPPGWYMREIAQRDMAFLRREIDGVD